MGIYEDAKWMIEHTGEFRYKPTIEALVVELGRVIAENMKLRDELVWAVRNGAYLSHDPEHTEVFDLDLYSEDGKLIDVHTESTDEGCLRAIRNFRSKSDGD